MPKNTLPSAADAPVVRTRKAGVHAARPRIAVDMVRVVAVARAGAAWFAQHSASGVGVSEAHLVSEIGASFAAAKRPGSPRRIATNATLAAFAAREGQRRFVCVHDDPACVAELISHLGEVWGATTTATGLDATIDELGAVGIDAERLCWNLIAHESLRHEKLVWRQAHRLAASQPNTSSEELLGYGWQGLRLGLRSYDPDRCLLATYAVPRINGAIRDGIRSEHHLPKRLVTMQRKLRTIDETLTRDLGRIPTLSEVADRFGADANQRSLMSRLARPASIDAWQAADSSDRAGEPAWIADPCDVADDALRTLDAQMVRDAVDLLPADEAVAVRLLVLDEVPLAEAAVRCGVPARQLSARRRRGLDSLAGLLSEFAAVGTPA